MIIIGEHNLVSRLLFHFRNDSLFRNSLYLMLGTAILASFGFFFWLINARLFTPEEVGIGTTLISVATLISSFSLLGLGNSLINYLPTSERKNETINTSLIITCLTSVIISVFFLVFLPMFSPKLLFIRNSIFFSAFFILFVVFSSANIIFEDIFIAYRSTVYVLIRNTILSLTKIILPFVLVALGSYGIFMSMGVALSVALVFNLIFLISKFKYIFALIVNMDIVRRMIKFSIGNYLAGFIGGLPAMVLPLLITNSIGANFSAYFYMDMMIANFLYVIPLAASQSLFAEGSYNETELKIHFNKAIKIISLILTPAIIGTLVLGKYILLAFGKDYSNEGVIFLRILSLSGIFVSINYLANALFYIKHKIKLIILVNFIGYAIILLLSMALVHHNLFGIGTAWIIGYGTTALVYLILIKKLL
jgi:O-antigen/teichoic acid export membrane protein